MQIWGPIVDTLPDYWLGALRDDQKIADAHVASGAASMVELWNAMALLYATESRDADAAQRQKLDPLYDAVIRICLQACEIVAVYHSTRPWKSACKRDPRREETIGIENGPTAVISVG